MAQKCKMTLACVCLYPKDLQPTKDEKVRFCAHCKLEVVTVVSHAEFAAARSKGQCVDIRLPHQRAPRSGAVKYKPKKVK